MASLSLTRLQQVIDRFEEVEARMGATSDSKEIIALSKEHSELRPVVEKARELLSARQGLKDAQALEASGDAEMAELARMEIEEIKDALPDLEEAMQILLLPKDLDDKGGKNGQPTCGPGQSRKVRPPGKQQRQPGQQAKQRNRQERDVQAIKRHGTHRVRVLLGIETI